VTARGVLAYGAYLPRSRLTRQVIADAHGATGSFVGARSVAGHDEDTTSMAVEAARAIGGVPADADVMFATTRPAYLDKTNATVLRAALGLAADGFAGDIGGAPRSAVAALRAGLHATRPTLVATSDIRTGTPGGGHERDEGDGAAAFVLGSGDDGILVAEYLGCGAVSGEFLDRWRSPTSPFPSSWDDRFAERAYAELLEPALAAALKDADLAAADLDVVVAGGASARAVRAVTRRLGLAVTDTGLESGAGYLGAAHPGLILAAALDTATAGQVVALVVLEDGADVLLFRATGAKRTAAAGEPVAALLEGARHIGYTTYLTWRAILPRDPGRRPDAEAPAAPPSWRHAGWKFGLAGSQCRACGQRQLPPQRVCAGCRAVDDADQVSFADTAGTVATFTVDWLAASPDPPTVFAVVDFDGGGRMQCELTDVDPASVEVGTRVEMTFRRLHSTNGIHNYFWKARPLRRLR
jgi:hydroxymethylglutaryl-CoA synthase